MQVQVPETQPAVKAPPLPLVLVPVPAQSQHLRWGEERDQLGAAGDRQTSSGRGRGQRQVQVQRHQRLWPSASFAA